jgi:hypothetical protein
LPIFLIILGRKSKGGMSVIDRHGWKKRRDGWMDEELKRRTIWRRVEAVALAPELLSSPLALVGEREEKETNGKRK